MSGEAGMPWVTLMLLSGLCAFTVLLVLWALLPARAIRPLPRHADWTQNGATTRLGPAFDPPPPMERDGGVAQRLPHPSSYPNRDRVD
jgi:hypothetical protein